MNPFDGYDYYGADMAGGYGMQPDTILGALSQPQQFAQQPQQPDIARQILSQRFEPTADDVGNAALAGISGNTYVDPQNYANNRMDRAFKQLSTVAELQQLPIKQMLAQAQLKKALQPEYKSIKGGERLIDPATGEVVFDGGPETMTPYQQNMLSLAERRLNMSANANNGLGKPPQGYRWNASGDGLEPIPGGPATKLPAEAGARLAQVDNAIGTIPEIRNLMVKPLVLNPVTYHGGIGDMGQGRRLVKQAVEAYLRAISGAAVPEPEVERALALYEPKPTDRPETRKRKIDQLENFLRGTSANIKKGRTAADDAAPQPDTSNDVSTYSDADLLSALGVTQ